MEIKIVSLPCYKNTRFFISINGDFNSWKISKILNMTFDDYINLCEQFGGIYVSSYCETYWKSKEEALKALEQLEPIFLMNILKGK